MNSRSDRESSTPEYSMDDLKTLNRRDLMTASECETRVTLTEKNWSAVVSLLTRLCSMLDMILATLATLLTRPDAEELLGQIERSTQMQLRQLHQTAEQFERQANLMSERYAAKTNGLLRSSEESLQKLESSTKNTLRDMTSETRSQIDGLIESARKWLTRLGMTSLLLLVVLGIIFGIVLLRKL